MSQYTISNNHLTLTAISFGAHLMSLKTSNGTEIIFQGDDKWKGKSPNLFPIVGVFPEKKYIFEGREYPIECHGVAPRNEYSVSKHTETELEFMLTDNEETRKNYPFSFAFFVNYKLDGDTLIYTLRAQNTGDKVMYCEMGTHTGFSVARSFKGAKIVFDTHEDKYTVKNDDPKKCGVRFINEQGELSLSDELFSTGAVTFGSLNSKSVTLVNEGSDYSITVGLGNYPNLTFWSAPESTYVCIEPWSCESAHYCKNIELTKQVGISVLKPGESIEFYNTISAKNKNVSAIASTR